MMKIKMKFNMEKVAPRDEQAFWRIFDDTGESVGFSYAKDHAELIVMALNLADTIDRPDLPWVEWPCGHHAGAVCAECWSALARRANALAGKLIEDEHRVDTKGLKL